MIRLIPGFVAIALLLVTLTANAQDFTSQDPRYTTTPPQYTTTPPEYTTTPPEYTTTPPEYTTTPPQYTTTPPEYVPQADTVPSTDVTIPTFPGNVPGGGNTIFQSSQLDSSTMAATASRQEVSLPSPGVTTEGEQEDIEMLEGESASENEPLVEHFAEFILRLDEQETQQFVSDYFEIVAQLGLESSDVSVEVGVRIVLYLTLSRLLGLSGLPFDAGAI